jgi:hypothetical protein
LNINHRNWKIGREEKLKKYIGGGKRRDRERETKRV